MGDIPDRTTDITIYGENGATPVNVNVDNELLTHDQHAIDLLDDIASGTGIISQNVTSSWEYFAGIGRTFVGSYGATFAGGTAETGFFLLKNPVASGRLVKINHLDLAVTTNTNGSFRIYRHPTITTVGTSVYIEQFGYHGSESGVGLLYSIPTYSVLGGKMEQYDVNSGGVGLLSIDFGLALIIKEGEQILITLEQVSNNNKFSANIAWAEEDVAI